MPWLRIGDTSATHPVVLAVRDHAADDDDRLLNEVFGFVIRCGALSTAHLTDYVISTGTARELAGSPDRYRALTDVAVEVGYFDRIEVDGKPAYKLIDDPDFIHMRTKAEITWERQRKADASNPELTIPVRIRDGDACRYCNLTVNFGARKGSKRGTYDHREPGQPARVDTYVVSCDVCNGKRGDDPNADRHLPLLPVPPDPYYRPSTLEWFASNRWAKENGIVPPSVSGPECVLPTGQRPDYPSVPPTVDPAQAPVTGNVVEQSAGSSRNPADPADPRSTGSVLSGRGGTGRVGSGRVGGPVLSDPPTDQRSRSSRRRARARTRHTPPAIPTVEDS